MLWMLLLLGRIYLVFGKITRNTYKNSNYLLRSYLNIQYSRLMQMPTVVPLEAIFYANLSNFLRVFYLNCYRQTIRPMLEIF